METYICPKCGNTKKVFAYIEEGGAHYDLDEEGMPTLTQTEIWSESEYYCGICRPSVKMKWIEDDEDEC